MAKRKASSDQPTDKKPSLSETIRVEGEIARMLSVIAIRTGLSVSEIVSPRIKSWVEDLYRETVEQMHRELH
jgi:hypothetical protein